jgi:hypothetical protein
MRHKAKSITKKSFVMERLLSRERDRIDFYCEQRNDDDEVIFLSYSLLLYCVLCCERFSRDFFSFLVVD